MQVKENRSKVMWRVKKFIWCYLLLKLPPFLLFLVLPHNIRTKQIKSNYNINYGKDRLQRYDTHFPNKANAPILFYIHGGSWMSLDKRYYNYIVKKMALSGYRVVNINYRLMPKVTLKDVVSDCEQAIAHALQNMHYTQESTPLFICGDSAGAHLAALIAAKANCSNAYDNLKFAGAGLFYGLYDFSNVKKSALILFLKEYLEREGQNTENYLQSLSPVYYVDKNFPPSYLAGGKKDVLFYGTESFDKHLQEKGIKTKTMFIEKNRWDGIHGFLNLTFMPSSKQGLAEVMQFFDKITINS